MQLRSAGIPTYVFIVVLCTLLVVSLIAFSIVITSVIYCMRHNKSAPLDNHLLGQSNPVTNDEPLYEELEDKQCDIHASKNVAYEIFSKV